MSVGTRGRVDEFDGNKDDWQQYVERLEHFFLANEIDSAEKQRAVFLSAVGAATYKTLRNIVSPYKPGDKTYKELVEALSRHFKPTPSVIVEHFKFHSRVRKAGESVATFVSELRSLSEYCNFGDSLEDMIRDRLVCGINDNGMQQRLLAEPDLTYAKAVELSLSAESAAQNMCELKVKSEGNPSTRSPQQEVYKTTVSPARGSPRPPLVCYRCGNRGHASNKCRISRDVVCHHCGKQGHLQRACRSKSKTTGTKTKYKTKTVGQVQEETETSGSDDCTESTLCHVRSVKSGTDSGGSEVG